MNKKVYVLISQGVEIHSTYDKDEAQSMMDQMNEEYYKYYEECVNNGEPVADNKVCMIEEDEADYALEHLRGNLVRILSSEDYEKFVRQFIETVREKLEIFNKAMDKACERLEQFQKNDNGRYFACDENECEKCGTCYNKEKWKEVMMQ